MTTSTTDLVEGSDLVGVPGSRGPSGRAPIGTWLRLAAADIAAIAGGLAVATLVRAPGRDGGVAAGILVAASIALLVRARLYQSRFVTRRADELRRVVDASFGSVGIVGLSAYSLDLDLDRGWVLLALPATIAALAIERELVRRRFAALRATGRRSRPVVIVGDNTEGERFAAMFAEEPQLGYTAVDRIDAEPVDDPTTLTTAVLASAREHGAHGVVIAATAIDTASSNRLIRDLVEAGFHVELSSTLADIAPERLTVRPLGRFPVVYIEPRRRQGWRALAKRSFDVVVACAALVVLGPVLAAIAIGVRATSSGPALFRQERIGRNGVAFDVLKFRTMVVDAEDRLAELEDVNEGSGPLFKMREDPRVTRIGSFLRSTSLDELPQLWNVVRNEMSLVGPRPALRDEMHHWDADLYARLRVRPGITGMWQVSGRSSTTFEEYTRLDLYYVDNWSLVVDLAILVKTIPAVLARNGAY